MASPTVEVAASQFLLACRADGLRPATIRWYRQMLKALITRLCGKSVEQITVGELRLYTIELRERGRRYVGAKQRPEIAGGLSQESIRDHLVAMRRFFAWAYKEYELEQARNPALRIRIPGRNHQEPKAIALEDLKRLIEATDDTPTGIRDRALIAFLTDTGCRAGGILTLKLADLYLDRRAAIIREKGDRIRTMPFGEYTGGRLSEWLEIRPRGGADTVFCSLGGRTPGRSLGLTGLHGVLKRLKKKAGVIGPVNPHSLRHRFGVQYILRGGDVASLSHLMGHSDPKTTIKFYTGFRADELAFLHAKFSPMNDVVKGK